MTVLLIHTFLAVIFAIILLLVSIILRNKSSLSRNKNRTFECGFDPENTARLPFSIRFFLLAVVFLIFDIEVALLFPILLGLQIKIKKISFLAGFTFLIILILGLIHEWNQGSLRWVN